MTNDISTVTSIAVIFPLMYLVCDVRRNVIYIELLQSYFDTRLASVGGGISSQIVCEIYLRRQLSYQQVSSVNLTIYVKVTTFGIAHLMALAVGCHNDNKTNNT